MNRRELIVKFGPYGILGFGLFALPRLHAALRCTPFAPNGVQQCEAGIDSGLIHTTALQEQSEWCWAACIEMVFRYYGFDVPQKRIVKETWGEVVNMPGQPYQIVRDLNRRWIAEDGKKFTVRGDVFTANAATAAQDLSQDKPLIIGTMGHAVVLTSLFYLRGFNSTGQVQNAVVRDPWPGRGKRNLTPREWYSIDFAARIRVAGDDDDN